MPDASKQLDRLALLGCGYVASRMARALAARGVRLFLVRRNREALEALLSTLPDEADVEAVAAPFETVADRLPAGVPVVLSAPPGESGVAAADALARALDPETRLVYLSTTGVYPAAGGQDVDDDAATGPISKRGQARLDVEETLLGHHENTAILRVPGIYGPGRGVHKRLLAGNYRLIGDANTLVSRIHVDDLAAGIELLASLPKLPRQRFNIGDEAPTSSRDHAMGVAARLGLDEPPTVAPDEVSADVRAMLGADRRILASGLRALGWRPRYPSWREGLEQIIEEEGL